MFVTSRVLFAHNGLAFSDYFVCNSFIQHTKIWKMITDVSEDNARICAAFYDINYSYMNQR